MKIILKGAREMKIILKEPFKEELILFINGKEYRFGTGNAILRATNKIIKQWLKERKKGVER